MATSITEVYTELTAPFAINELEIRIGSKNKNRDKATVLVYTSAQVIEERLDRVVGPDNWQVHYQINDHGVTCTLELYDRARSAIADLGKNEDMSSMAAQARAFKRAASSFGIGRYLWQDSKQVWAELNDSGFGFRDSTEKLINRVLNAPAQTVEAEPEVRGSANTPRPQRPAAPATGAKSSDGKVSEGQLKALKAHKVPADLFDVITFKQAKGKTYGGEGLLDALAEAHDEKGKQFAERDALTVLAGFGIIGSNNGTEPASELDYEMDDL